MQPPFFKKQTNKFCHIFCLLFQENPIPNFKVAEQLTFMQELEARYRPSILSDLQNITKP